MKKIAVWIALDYPFAHVQLCVLDRTGRNLVNASCDNDWRAIAARVRPEWRVKGVSIEACSGAADMAEELIPHMDWPVTLTHPGTAARMKRNPDHEMKRGCHLTTKRPAKAVMLLKASRAV